MRRRREDASSLELLLDTMCNTFGGVMFIAISLVVVISMVRSASRALEENAPRKLEQLQQELARLEREAAESRESVEQRRELAGLLAAGPMREELEMLAAQEAQVRRLTDRKLAQEAKSAVLRPMPPCGGRRSRSCGRRWTDWRRSGTPPKPRGGSWNRSWKSSGRISTPPLPGRCISRCCGRAAEFRGSWWCATAGYGGSGRGSGTAGTCRSRMWNSPFPARW